MSFGTLSQRDGREGEPWKEVGAGMGGAAAVKIGQCERSDEVETKDEEG